MAKRGRPSKLNNIDLNEVEKLASQGLTDEQIATAINISERTLNRYKKNLEFCQSLKRGKHKADSEVVKSLYKRANGYSYTETTREPMLGGALTTNNNLVVTKEITKQVVPDTTAQIFWLKNRCPGEWRDKQDIEHSVAEKTYDFFKNMKGKYNK